MQKRLAKIGFGAIVDSDELKPWVKPETYKKLLSFFVNEMGVSYLDTAQLYGLGEITLGDWLKNYKDQGLLKNFKIGTKLSGKDKYEDSYSPLTKYYVENTLQRSIERIGSNPLDIYWLHFVNDKTDLKSILTYLVEAKDRGNILKIGLSNISLANFERLISICSKDKSLLPNCIQNQFNLLSDKSSSVLIKKCEDMGIDFYAYSPLAGGLLTGKYGLELQKHDSTTRWSYLSNKFGSPNFWNETIYSKIMSAEKMAVELKVPLATLCLAWVRGFSGVETVIYGPKNMEQTGFYSASLNTNVEKLALEHLSAIFGFDV